MEGEEEGEGVGGGVPLPHQGVFACLGFKISDLVHTFCEFHDVQPMRKKLEGEGVSPSHSGEFMHF